MTDEDATAKEQAATGFGPTEPSGDRNAAKENVRDENDNVNDDENDIGPSFCTYAVTGNQPSFQAIFVCIECFQEEKATTGSSGEDAAGSARTEMTPLCICQACADACHNDDFHDVEYIGMGPATCDCNHLGSCKIYEKSVQEAKRLGIRPQTQGSHANPPTPDNSENPEMELTKRSDATAMAASMMKQIFEIPFLQDIATSNFLVQHAQELIRHTKETHWIDERLITTCSKVSPLETMAWSMYQFHRQHHEILLDNDDQVNHNGGAEWWVQIKDTTADPFSKNNSIDLHYDKDEALAESFGLGSFPTFSIVTYLTPTTQNSAPTIVLDHTYNQGEDEVMNYMLVSRPKLGKHLLFDGRLLHGAPYHPCLQPGDGNPGNVGNTASELQDQKDRAQFRVTFLVNIWKDRRPANVQVLDDRIRQIMLEMQINHYNTKSSCSIEYPLSMTPMKIPTFLLNEEENLSKESQTRIELLFVSDKTLMIGEEDGNENDGLVVVTFPPPPTEDSVLCIFGPGMQAYLDYTQRDYINSDSHGEEGKTQPQPLARETDYV